MKESNQNDSLGHGQREYNQKLRSVTSEGAVQIRRNLAEQAQHVLQTARDLGVTVSPSSRLDRMARLYTGPDGQPREFIPANHREFAVAREGVRDMLQFGFILDRVGSSAGLAKLLKQALRDAALPQESAANTPGRDTQAELYVAAICAGVAMDPQFAEPDVQCRWVGKSYGLAVKRLKSLKQFDERFDKAAEQVKRSGMAGMIVMDISLAMNPHNMPVTLPLSDETYGEMTKDHIRRFLDAELSKLTEKARGSGALGLMLLNHDIRQQPGGNWGLHSVTIAADFSPHNARRRRECHTFFEQFKRGLASAPP